MDQNVTQASAVTFATVDRGQGANELYDMDQNVKTDSNVTFGNVTATGTVTAEEFHTEFVSASIVYVSGSTKFGDTSDDIHSFTGSIHLVNSGSVSGSSTSTGSFGRVEGRTDFTTIDIDNDEIPIAKLASDNVNFGGVTVTLGASDTTPAFDLSDATAYTGDSSLVTTGTVTSGIWNSTFGSTANTIISGSTNPAAVSGSWQGVIGSGSLGMVSGSAISTGSFGAVNVAGMTVPNLLDFSSSLASRITSEEGDFTAAGISGSWQGVVGSGSLGMVSGSAISTGSFGYVNVAGMTTPSILALSSSIEKRLNTLSADIIALSIALG